MSNLLRCWTIRGSPPTLEWTKKVVEMLRWRYEVWSEPPVTDLADIRFLAGFRNPRFFDDELQLSADKKSSGGHLGEVFSIDIGRPPALVRSAVLHTDFCLATNGDFLLSLDGAVLR